MITGLIEMKDASGASLRRRRRTLLKRLPPLQDLLRGSLIERFKPCGKPGCRCARGPGHGPKHYLSVSRSGAHPRMDYVPQTYTQEVRQWLSNYRLTRSILDEVCEINRELLRRREEL